MCEFLINMKNTISTILTILISCAVLSTDMAAEELKDSSVFLFHQGKSNLDLSFGENEKTAAHLSAYYNDSINPVLITKLKIIGGASPEGSVSLNKNLSDRRALTIADFINTGINPETEYCGRDWNGLLGLVENDSLMPYKSETINIINDIILDNNTHKVDDIEGERNLNRLKRLHGGIPYRYMYSHLFPKLRASRVYVAYIMHPDIAFPGLFPYKTDIYIPTPQPLVIPPVSSSNKTRGGDKEKNFYMSLKTNLLYDIAALPTIGAEFYIGKNISVTGNWTYGWWSTNSRHRYWRAYGGDIGLRWWFGKAAKEKPLTGHHIGIYGGITTYDFEFGGSGRMGGLPGHNIWDRCMHLAGVEYGYSLPIASRLNMDFTIGLGYMGGKYIKYKPHNNGYMWESTNRLHWIGPTKLEISLVWLLGKGNKNTSYKNMERE